MNNIQFIEQNGKREYAIIPMSLFEKSAPSLEELDDIADLEEFRSHDDGFRIPEAVANSILDGTQPIKAWRTHRELTQDEVANQAGISKAYLSQIENKKRAVSLKSLKAIASVLGVTVDDLEG